MTQVVVEAGAAAAVAPPRVAAYWVVSDISPSNAGFRIRTAPLIEALARRGEVLTAIDQAELLTRFVEIAETARLVIVAKPGDTASYLCLRALIDRRVFVAIDLYDNYFSWSAAIERRELHWLWLRSLEVASLVITSTAYLEGVVRSLRAGAVVRVADPLPPGPVAADDLRHIAAKWPLEQRLEILWFGISGNPHFRAGLADLADWLPVLTVLRDRLAAHLDLRLTVCTNRHPAVESTLGVLRREGIGVRFVEWTEPVCASLQGQAHLVLLPTNLSGFSLSKTHNRCSDAVTRGCLVLASPHGPYRHVGGAVFLALDPLISRLLDARHDEAGVTAALRQSQEALATWADVDQNADRLLAALRAPADHAAAGAPASAQRILIVARSRVETVKFSRLLGYLSAGFPAGVTRANFDFSVVLDGEPGQAGLAWIRLTPKALQATLAAVAIAAADGRLDLVEGEKQLVCRADGWRLVVDRTTRTCAIVACPDDALRDAVAMARLLQPHSTHGADRWYGAMVALLVRTLQRLGFDRLDFAADEGGGWPAFAGSADPKLVRSEKLLRELWHRHAGHEVDWVVEPGSDRP